jgi:hypothetical protein
MHTTGFPREMSAPLAYQVCTGAHPFHFTVAHTLYWGLIIVWFWNFCLLTKSGYRFIGRRRKSGDHPSESLANSEYKPHMKYCSIFLLYTENQSIEI